MPHGHDDTFAVALGVLRSSGDLEAVGTGIGIDDKRMVARSQKRARQALQQTDAGVDDSAGLAVHDATGGTDDVPAKGPADALVSHADPEKWKMRSEFGHGLERDARFFGGSGPGGDEYPRRVRGCDLGDGNGVVGVDDVVAAEVAEVLF